ncbi:TraB/GumN family protein [Geoglobus acetivorans]|uniref:Conjugal transfer protein TraB n=1 Tax=Geoglobus acetivorans TaxID=565033 RepID=A0A0A7GGA4_GEOAI|nr:conjugal transfer protein TraB [Geoglobus acetivorans]
MSEEKKLVIVGTAHVSRKSVEEVVRTIEEEKPDAVAVELDLRRYKALEGEREEINLLDVIKRGNVFLLLFQLVLSNFQRRIGRETGVMPGEEMLSAIEKAKEIGADVLLIDRDLAVTFNRLWSSLGFFEKLKLFFHIVRGLFESDDIEVDDLLEKDILDMLTEEFRKISPKTAEVLIDERDAYMTHNLLRAMQRYSKIVAVVGAGHKKGIEKLLSNPQELPDMASLVEVRRKRFSSLKLLGFGITLLVLGIMFTIFVKLGTSEFLSAFAVWFLANGILSAIFAGIAGAHPLSILVAFLMAWLTSLSPFLAAGWFSGLTEFIVRKPTQHDLEEMLSVDSLRALYRNRAFRVLFVAAMTNIGSTIGTFYGIWYLSTHYGVDIKEVIFSLIRF